MFEKEDRDCDPEADDNLECCDPTFLLWIPADLPYGSQRCHVLDCTEAHRWQVTDTVAETWGCGYTNAATGRILMGSCSAEGHCCEGDSSERCYALDDEGTFSLPVDR